MLYRNNNVEERAGSIKLATPQLPLKMKEIRLQETLGKQIFDNDAKELFNQLQKLLQTQSKKYLDTLTPQLQQLKIIIKIYLELQTLKLNDNIF